MKLLSVLLLFISTTAFSQSGYYYFSTTGKLEEGIRSKGQAYVSYAFYADNQPVCATVYRFLDLNYPHFNYKLNNDGCRIEGPFSTQEEAKKNRERHVDRLRNNQFSSVTNIIYDDKTKDSKASTGFDPD